MKLKHLYIVFAVIFFMAGLVNLTFPDKVMITFSLAPLGKKLLITSTHIGAIFFGFAIITWLARLSSYPKFTSLGRVIIALFLGIIIFLIIIMTGILSEMEWLASLIAIFLVTGSAYFIFLKRKNK